MISTKIRQALRSDEWRTSPKVSELLREALLYSEQLHVILTNGNDLNTPLDPTNEQQKRAIFLVSLAKFSLYCQDEKDSELLTSVRDLIEQVRTPLPTSAHFFPASHV